MLTKKEVADWAKLHGFTFRKLGDAEKDWHWSDEIYERGKYRIILLRRQMRVELWTISGYEKLGGGWYRQCYLDQNGKLSVIGKHGFDLQFPRGENMQLDDFEKLKIELTEEDKNIERFTDNLSDAQERRIVMQAKFVEHVFGVRVGSLVKSKGAIYKVRSLRLQYFDWKHQGRPWLTGLKQKADGKYGVREFNIYNDWEIVDEVQGDGTGGSAEGSGNPGTADAA